MDPVFGRSCYTGMWIGLGPDAHDDDDDDDNDDDDDDEAFDDDDDGNYEDIGGGHNDGCGLSKCDNARVKYVSEKMEIWIVSI